MLMLDPLLALPARLRKRQIHAHGVDAHALRQVAAQAPPAPRLQWHTGVSSG